MLTEAQIQRYARHILLPEVGGVGQEKLCQAQVRVSGESALVELAGDYLSAAGVTVDAHSGAGLSIELMCEPPAGGDTPAVSLQVNDDAVLVVPGREPRGPLPLESGTIAACLAATEILRAIIELGAPRGWKVRGASVERLP